MFAWKIALAAENHGSVNGVAKPIDNFSAQAHKVASDLNTHHKGDDSQAWPNKKQDNEKQINKVYQHTPEENLPIC